MPSAVGIQTGCCALCQKTKSNKQCSSCKVVVYCSAACQKKDWKNHKGSCSRLPEKLLSRAVLNLMGTKLFLANEEKKWEEIVSKKPYMDQMMWEGNDAYREKVLNVFSAAYRSLDILKSGRVHSHDVIDVDLRRVELYKRMKKFGKAGSLLVLVGFTCYHVGRFKESRDCFEKANASCQITNSLGTEAESMVGLGMLILEQKMQTSMAGVMWSDGLDMMRSGSFAASMVSTDPSNRQQLFALRVFLTYLVVKEETLVEAEEVVDTFQRLAKQTSANLNYMVTSEMQAYLFTASIHKVRHNVIKFEETMIMLFDRLRAYRTTSPNQAKSFAIVLSHYKRDMIDSPMQSALSGELLWIWTAEESTLRKIAGY